MGLRTVDSTFYRWWGDTVHIARDLRRNYEMSQFTDVFAPRMFKLFQNSFSVAACADHCYFLLCCVPSNFVHHILSVQVNIDPTFLFPLNKALEGWFVFLCSGVSPFLLVTYYQNLIIGLCQAIRLFGPIRSTESWWRSKCLKQLITHHCPLKFEMTELHFDCAI
jgi:hypothetical protein